MGSVTKHYGLPTLRAACGAWVRDVTADRDAVTCLSCQATVKYRRGWFAPTDER